MVVVLSLLWMTVEEYYNISSTRWLEFARWIFERKKKKKPFEAFRASRRKNKNHQFTLKYNTIRLWSTRLLCYTHRFEAYLNASLPIDTRDYLLIAGLPLECFLPVFVPCFVFSQRWSLIQKTIHSFISSTSINSHLCSSSSMRPCFSVSLRFMSTPLLQPSRNDAEFSPPE